MRKGRNGEKEERGHTSKEHVHGPPHMEVTYKLDYGDADSIGSVARGRFAGKRAESWKTQID